jgi:hypothetical protein
MSGSDTKLPDPEDGVMWWNEGEWQPIPSGMLDPEAHSTAVLAINAAEYPALSALIRYADDVESYLRMLGVEYSISEQEDSSNALAEGEEEMGMDA